MALNSWTHRLISRALIRGCIDAGFFYIFFAPPGYGTGREPAPAPSTGGVLQA